MSRPLPLLAAALVAGALFGASGVSARPAATFVYLHSRNDANIHGYRINTRGQLTVLPGFPVATGDPGGSAGGQCHTLVYSPKKKLLLASGNSGISSFTVNRDGSLTRRATGVGATKIIGLAMLDMGAKTYVFGAAFEDDQLLGYSVSAAGVLTPLPANPIAVGDGPAGVIAHKGMLFANSINDYRISSFKVASNGTLRAAPGGPITAKVNDLSYVYNAQITPNGKFLYSGDNGNQVIHGFKINARNAQLTRISGAPFSTPGLASTGSSLSNQSIGYFYQRNLATANVQAVRRDGSGRLTRTGTLQDVGMGVDAGITDPTGKLLILGDDETDTIKTYKVNTSNGMLTAVDFENAPLDGLNAVIYVKR